MKNAELNNTKVWLLPAVIVSMFVFGFWPAFEKLVIRWNSDENSYCYLIIPLFLYLCWENKKKFNFRRFSWNRLGLIPVLLSILIMATGEFGSMETILYTGIYGCFVGIMFILYGLRLRRLLFPLLILSFIIPLPPFLGRMLTFNLKLAASTFSVGFLRMAGVSVLQDGNIIEIGITQLQVVDACSGLRYFVPLILMALLFGYFYTKRLWQKVGLLLVVLPLSIVVNGLRIFFTGMLHIWGHPELAEDFFHDFSGWVVFMIAGAVLYGVTMALRHLSSVTEVKTLIDTGSCQSKRMVSVTITIVLCLIFFSSGYALQKLPSTANLPARKSFDYFPMTIGNWFARRSFLTDKILDELWADDYINATFFRSDMPNAIHLFIPFYEYQGTRHTAHAPRACLLGGGWALVGSRERIMIADSGSELKIETSIWKKGDTRILGSYFFFQRGRVITNPWENKYWLFVDGLIKQRTDGALVRVEMTMVPGQSVEEAYMTLEEFVGQVFAILPEYVPI